MQSSLVKSSAPFRSRVIKELDVDSRKGKIPSDSAKNTTRPRKPSGLKSAKKPIDDSSSDNNNIDVYSNQAEVLYVIFVK